MTALPIVTPSPVKPTHQIELAAFGLPPLALDLSTYNAPAFAVLPLLHGLRYWNTSVDALFYDVQRLWLSLYTRGVTVSTAMDRQGAAATNGLEALSAPPRGSSTSARWRARKERSWSSTRTIRRSSIATTT